MVIELTLTLAVWKHQVAPALAVAGCLTHVPRVVVQRQTPDHMVIALTVVEGQRLCVDSVLTHLGVPMPPTRQKEVP